MWSCVLQALGSRAVYQGESYIILLVNALHVHFYSSAWQYLLYFVADSNRNRPCAGGLSMDNSEPSVAVPLLLPGHQSVVVWELYPCRYSTGVSDAELTDKTAPLPVTAGNNGACDQMTARHAGHKELFSPLFFLNTWPRIWSVFLSLCCCPDVLLLFSPHSKVLQCQARHPHSCCNSCWCTPNNFFLFKIGEYKKFFIRVSIESLFPRCCVHTPLSPSRHQVV